MFMGPTWGPPGSCWPRCWPHVGPMNPAIRDGLESNKHQPIAETFVMIAKQLWQRKFLLYHIFGGQCVNTWGVADAKIHRWTGSTMVQIRPTLFRHKPFHLPLNKMDAISQMTFSNIFLWMKGFVFWMIFHWSMFLRIKLTVFQHWFR